MSHRMSLLPRFQDNTKAEILNMVETLTALSKTFLRDSNQVVNHYLETLIVQCMYGWLDETA